MSVKEGYLFSRWRISYRDTRKAIEEVKEEFKKSQFG